MHNSNSMHHFSYPALHAMNLWSLWADCVLIELLYMIWESSFLCFWCMIAQDGRILQFLSGASAWFLCRWIVFVCKLSFLENMVLFFFLTTLNACISWFFTFTFFKLFLIYFHGGFRGLNFYIEARLRNFISKHWESLWNIQAYTL